MTILQRDDGITHVVLAGRLDTTGAEDIDATYSAATAGRARPAIVDLSEIDFMASRGIGMLIASGRRLRKAGHGLVLLNPKGLVESVLRTAKVNKVIPLAYDLDEALGILQGAPSLPVAASPELTPAAEETQVARPEPAPPPPSAIEGQLRLTIQNELSELKGLYATLAVFLDAHRVPHRAAYALNLAIDELVTNVIRYAYVDYDPHFIDIELTIENNQGVLRIVDDGRPFDPRTGPTLDVHAEEREVGGLGLLLVLDLVDTLNYRRAEERNCVEVRVHLIPDDMAGAATAASGDVPESHES